MPGRRSTDRARPARSVPRRARRQACGGGATPVAAPPRPRALPRRCPLRNNRGLGLAVPAMSERTRPWYQRARWWGAAGGALLALADTATLAWLGVRFDMNGRPVSWLVLVFFGSSSTVLGYLIGALLDGRRRVRRDAAVIQAQTEAIAAARARLAESEKLATLGQLAAAIAHEVRNPLAVIRSAAQGLGETARPDDAEAARASAFITAEVDRLA